MTVVVRTALVPYSTEQMFRLVNDIEHYPAFLEWCEATEVHARDENEVTATLHLNWRGLKQSFTTVNRLQTNKMMDMRLLDGPFKNLDGYWQFDAIDTMGCKVTASLEFEFSHTVVSLAFSQVFDYVAGNLVSAFCARADAVYGSSDA